MEKGDKLRAFHFIRILSENHEIHLFSLSDQNVTGEDLSMLQSWCKTITIERIKTKDILRGIFWSLLHQKPFQIGYFHKPIAFRIVNKLIREISPDVVFCQLVRVAEYATGFKGIKVLDYQDSFSMNMARRAKASSFIHGIVFRREARLLKKVESKVFNDFGIKLIISEPDREAIAHPGRDQIIVVPNGVDFDYFKPSEENKKDYDIVFTGNMSYAPNVEAAVWLAEEILPHIRKKLPGTTLLLAGASPVKRIRVLAGNGITVTGWMPDIRDAYNRSRLFIAPLRTGSGLQNKLLEAMAMELPCITTTLANASLKATNGVHLHIADKVQDIAEIAIKMLENRKEASEIAIAGNRMVKKVFQWKINTNIISNKLKNT